MERDRERLLVLSHRLIRLRLVGWVFVGMWQALSLLSEFVPLVDLESRPVRIAGKVLGVVGLLLIAYGFERFAEASHRLAGLHK